MEKVKFQRYFWIIILVAVVLRLIYVTGFVYDDTFPYSVQAANIADGRYDMNADLYYAMNISFIFMLGLFVSVFGKNPVGFYAWPFIAGVLTVVLGMVMAKRYYGEKVALITGLLLATSPIFILWSTIPHPDSLNPLLWNLFLFFFIRGELASTQKETALNFILAGFIMGFSFYTRIFSIILFVVVPISFLIYRRFSLSGILRYAWLIPGFSIAFLMGNGAYYIWEGDFFLRYHSTLLKKSWIVNTTGNTWFWEETPATFDWFVTIPFRYAQGFLSPFNFLDWGWVFYGALLGAIASWKKKIEGRKVVWVWFAGIYVALDIVLNTVTSVPNWLPYIMAIVLPASILFALWVTNLEISESLLRRLKDNSRIVWAILFSLLLGILLVDYCIFAERFPEFLLNVMEPYEKAWLAIAGVFLAITALMVILVISYVLLKQTETTNQANLIIRGSLLVAYVASSIIFVTAKRPILYNHTAGVMIAIKDQISDLACKNVYYQSYKTSTRLLPQYWFNSDYFYQMTYESWNVPYQNRLIHFEFLPPDIDSIERGDCILLYEPDYTAFVEHNLGPAPHFAEDYQYPEYLRELPKTWRLVFSEYANALYFVEE